MPQVNKGNRMIRDDNMQLLNRFSKSPSNQNSPKASG